MTLFAVACADLFPMLHLGRPWFAYWLFPYPSTMAIQPQFRSPLVWDVFAVSTYFTVSLLFWFLGLIPDLATLRDRARGRVPRFIYGMLAMGWRGSAIHWHRYEMAYLLLAGSCDAAGRFGSYGGEFRFRRGARARLALDHFPALFRRRRNLFRLCHGADDRDPIAQALRARRLHHHAPSEEHGHRHARHRHDRRLRLFDGNLHGVVQRRYF